jgi:long-chain acyl-CoA synthetase
VWFTALVAEDRRWSSGARKRFGQLLDEAPAEAEVIDFEGAWWTWGQLHTLARELDALLTGLELGAGARVGLVLENRPEDVGVIAALLAGDRCLVTLSPLQPAERLAADITRSALPVVLASPDVLDRPGVRDAIVEFGVAIELSRAASLRVLAGSVRTDQQLNPGVSIEMLTSGTTGPPKRVELGDVQLNRALESSGQAPKAGVLLARGVSLVSTPMVHIGGLWGAVAGLYAGRRLAVLPRFSLGPWVDAVEKHQLRAAGLVPAAMRTLLDSEVPPERLESLQVVTSGTAPCPPEQANELLRRYGVRVLMTYGATEFAGAVVGWTLPLHLEWWERKAGSAGRPYPGVRVRVVDDTGTELAEDTVGHLEIRTAQAPQGGDVWVRTSDLARIDADGFVWITGRADDAIIRGGFKVAPDQVKRVLETHPAVREAAVAGLPDERLGQIPVAAVQREPGVPAPTMDELLALCRQHLTPYEVPVYIAVLDELPRTPSSKVSRVDLLDIVRTERAELGAA